MNRTETKRMITVTASTGRTRRPLALLSLLLGLTLVVTACGGGAAPTATSAGGGTTATATRPAAAATAAATTAAAVTRTTAPPVGGAVTATRTTTVAGAATRTTTVAGAATRTATAGSPVAGGTPNTSITITGKQGDADSLNGTGATFPQVLYSRWFEEYNRATGVQINYQGTGSSAGKNAIRDGTADFAGSDSPMNQQELDAARQRCGEAILHIPTTLGSIVLAYNLPNLSGAPLKMDADTIAGIFLDRIKRWNDPAIATQNPGVNLPNQEIITVHRSDGSGTTQNFTEYLAAANEAWRNGPRAGTTVQWPGGIGAQGNQGVAGEVKNNPYAIGYMELAFAKQSQLPYADVRNRDGQYVTPSAASVTAAGEALAPTLPPDLRSFLANAPGARSYPITAITWILVCPRQTDGPKAIALTRMLWWATHTGQQFNEQLDYAPLPNIIIVRAEQFISQITVNGQRAFPGR